MVDISQHQQQTVAAIYAGWEKRRDGERRGHLGASIIGRECSRALWYTFRWAGQGNFDGRMLRLFDRGHREEPVMVAELRAAGVTVHDVDDQGQQFRFKDFGGHFAGSMDGAAIGILEAPKTWHVLEFKTHNAKSFDMLAKKGVQQAKPEHWAQMQMYMGWSEMTRAFYLAACKNDDRLYSERIRFDSEAFERLRKKAKDILQSERPPQKVNDNPDYYLCKFCDFREHCHGVRVAAVTCRSCIHSTPEMDGDARWSCARWQHDLLTIPQQERACDEHRFIPDLVPHSEAVDADEDWIEYKVKETGAIFRNGKGGYTSTEINALDPKLIGDPVIAALRDSMNETEAS